jgi:hypothetical protein
MAAVSSRFRAAGLALAAALAAVPLAAQQTLDQPVYAPPAKSRIETAPLPPIGGDAGVAGTPGDAAADGVDTDAGRGTLPQPRFVRVPSADDDADDDDGQDTGEAGLQDGLPVWDRSPDGRFHRAPEGSETAPSTATAPGPVVPIDPPPTDLRAGARLRELDKMTGQTKTFEIGVGETREVDRLRIQLEACRSPEGNDMHGTMAFLKVWDKKYSDAEAAFSGWMFAESPALSALDHPRYDLWVISCTTSALGTEASRQ